MPEGNTNWRRRMLVRGARNLAAMRKTIARPTTSPADKKTLAEMIVKQEVLNKTLLGSLIFREDERT